MGRLVAVKNNKKGFVENLKRMERRRPGGESVYTGKCFRVYGRILER